MRADALTKIINEISLQAYKSICIFKPVARYLLNTEKEKAKACGLSGTKHMIMTSTLARKLFRVRAEFDCPFGTKSVLCNVHVESCIPYEELETLFRRTVEGLSCPSLVIDRERQILLMLRYLECPVFCLEKLGEQLDMHIHVSVTRNKDLEGRFEQLLGIFNEIRSKKKREYYLQQSIQQ